MSDADMASYVDAYWEATNKEEASRPLSDDGVRAIVTLAQKDYCMTGMSLRDNFATAAMNAELISSGSLPESAEALANEASRNGVEIEVQIALHAYALADAMLWVRDGNADEFHGSER